MIMIIWVSPRFESCGNKGTEESTLGETRGKDSSVPLMHNDPSDHKLVCLVKKIMQNPVFGFKNPIFDFPKRTL